jgi:hypothetical protein
MTRSKLATMTITELLARFADIGIAQDRALLENEIRKFNRLYDQNQVVVEELKSRPGDQRRALLNLYDHANAQVRLNAVKETLAIEPEIARSALQEIADSNHYPQAGDAGMSLLNLERGIFKPE